MEELVAHNTSHFVHIARKVATAGDEMKRELDKKLLKAHKLLLETPGTISRWHAFLTRAVRLADEEFRVTASASA